tara:strand:+ start:720 stop:878 length:159 start_codon:yes stop_codon:yes gene_type:complete
MDPNHFSSFGALEAHRVVMIEFKSQFHKEFGVLINAAEPPMDICFTWKQSKC